MEKEKITQNEFNERYKERCAIKEYHGMIPRKEAEKQTLKEMNERYKIIKEDESYE